MNKAILWDFDGTLSHPNRSFSTALYDAITQCGHAAHREETVAFTENVYSWKSPDRAYPHQTGEDWWAALYAKTTAFCRGQGIAPADIPEINCRFRKLLTDVNNYRLYDDTLETLRLCAALGYKNYLATNNYPEITAVVRKLGLDPFLTGCIVSSHIGYEKPRKEFYDYGKRLCGHPETLYMVGDNPIADILGAKNAGLVTVAVHACKNSPADHYFETLKEIPAILP